MARLPQGKRNYRGRGPQIRKNERIRVREVRVIGPDGAQIGVMATQDALKLAKDHGLDLIEISAAANPPVCRILDFGKYMYDQSKKQKDQKTTSQKVKEIKLRVKIDQHDYAFKVQHAEDFLSKGAKVKISLQFRGREMEHKDLGFQMVKRAIQDLSSVGQMDTEPKLMGRMITAMVSPLPSAKKKVVAKKVTPSTRPESPATSAS